MKDAAGALLKCPVLSGAEGLEAPIYAVKGEAFNVGSDEQNYRIVELGKLIEELIPDVRVARREEDTDQRNSCTELGRSNRVSFDKTCTEPSRSIRKHLRFEPRHTVADGVTSTSSAQAGRSRQPWRTGASPTGATFTTATTRRSATPVLSVAEGRATRV